jgi:hypothetical protein
MKLETFHNSDEPVIYAYYVSVKDDAEVFHAEVFLDEWDAKDWAIENSNGEDYKIIPLYKIAEPAEE